MWAAGQWRKETNSGVSSPRSAPLPSSLPSVLCHSHLTAIER